MSVRNTGLFFADLPLTTSLNVTGKCFIFSNWQFNALNLKHCLREDRLSCDVPLGQATVLPGGGGGTLGISGWECAPGTLKPLTYTRASSAEFCYPVLE